ncbi:serine hydrolase domain-containing protein [Streptomyces griseochromogenes]|uniref:serine hydrolase domain-containing protein n=1 Tax=Streptomyces griseochromogenes TaxID=68214 RepID=UPI0037972103
MSRPGRTGSATPRPAARRRPGDGPRRGDIPRPILRCAGSRPVGGKMASTSKTLVATVVLQLETEGRLSLNDTVADWLPGVVRGSGNDGSRITIRQLLQHTSGIHDDLPGYTTPEEYYQRSHDVYGPQQLVARAMAHAPDFLPGGGWEYFNTGYILLGMIIQKATGQPAHQEIEDRILRLLGLDRTQWVGTSPTLPRPHAQAYQFLRPRFRGGRHRPDTGGLREPLVRHDHSGRERLPPRAARGPPATDATAGEATCWGPGPPWTGCRPPPTQQSAPGRRRCRGPHTRRSGHRGSPSRSRPYERNSMCRWLPTLSVPWSPRRPRYNRSRPGQLVILDIFAGLGRLAAPRPRWWPLRTARRWPAASISAANSAIYYLTSASSAAASKQTDAW